MNACPCREKPIGYWARAVCRPMTYAELAVAAAVGFARHEASWRRQDRDRLYDKDEDEAMEVNVWGAYGEAAYSILFGVPWPMSVDTFHTQPDFPPDVDVKHRRAPGRPLIVRPDSHDDWRYLAASTLPDGRIQFEGWLWGSEGKTWPVSDPGGWRPAHLVPVELLHRLPFSMKHVRQEGLSQ